MSKLILIAGLLVSAQCFALDLGGIIDRVSDNFDRKAGQLVEETANEAVDGLLDEAETEKAKATADNRRAQSAAKSEASPVRVSQRPSKRDSLRELKELKDEGLISESEYTEGRKEILARPY